MTWNLYGCTDCPVCGGDHRCRFQGAMEIVTCDDCGSSEPATTANCDEAELPPILSYRKRRQVLMRRGLTTRVRMRPLKVRDPHRHTLKSFANFRCC